MAERRARALSLRARITLGAALAVAAGLVLGALGFYFALSASLTENLRAAALQDATAIAAQIDALGLTDDDNSGRGGGDDDDAQNAPEHLDALLDFGDDRFVQIFADDGSLLASEPDSIPADVQFVSAQAEADEHVRVVAGRSTAQLSETLATVGLLLAVSVPLLVALVALVTWLVVGRALAPVERMRRELDAVTAADLGRRVDEPPGNDEIGRLAHTMNGMLDRLEAAQRAQRRFISDASHELKSPLASLRQYAEVARAHPERIGQAELSDAVLDEGGRLEHLVQGMLVLARTDEGALPLTLGEVDLDDVVLAEAKRLRELGRVTVDTRRVGPARLRGDAGLLRQLVRNLADNAARHARGAVAFELGEAPRGPAGAGAGTGAGAAGPGVLLVVRDDGDGIAPADRERVFERFLRLDDARSRAGGGSGLGLAIVAEIVRAHGGTVAVRGAEPEGAGRGAVGTGAVFEVWLPQRA
ncbi:ATP-binding protein [Microterricola viridarii]|uniref:histidine kinase n=1 Tax=Microterricola viridarii TaxID=412690 RepID=A0A1H1Y8S2_9MICO|nr:ATP-binding protein [Microterricola viridarii]SDT17659.1 Signal transduction histidine kinase [Microterricola viridarii]